MTWPEVVFNLGAMVAFLAFLLAFIYFILKDS